MMLLTDKEIDACLSNPSMHIQARIIYRDFARAIESAILAKLASAELPEPATVTVLKEIPYYTYDQLCEAYAQGAAAQLSAEPSGFIDRYGEIFAEAEQMLSTDTPLYTRRQA